MKLVIENKLNIAAYLQELWIYRGLILLFSWRDISVKYKQTILGMLWVVFRPIALILIFTFLFNKVARVDAGEVPYIVIVLTGMLPWFYFSSTFSESCNSIVANSSLVNKVYFPRLLLLLSCSITNLIDVLVHIFLLFAICLYLGVDITPRFLLIPLFYLTLGFFAIALSMGLSCLNVKHRDVQQVIPFMLQFLLYASPVAYSSSLIESKLRSYYSINPLVGVIEIFRWIIAPATSNLQLLDVLSTIICFFILFILGLFYFIKSEPSFSDYL
jgi:lipopolysaccharide transport system permease protein